MSNNEDTSVTYEDLDVDWYDDPADNSDVIGHTGDLGSILTEMDGFAQDCGRSYTQDKHLISYVDGMFEGGLNAFVLAVAPLW